MIKGSSITDGDGFRFTLVFLNLLPMPGNGWRVFERRGRHSCPVDEYTRVTSTFKCTFLDAADLRL